MIWSSSEFKGPARFPSAQRITASAASAERSEVLVRCKPKLARHAPEHDIDAASTAVRRGRGFCQPDAGECCDRAQQFEKRLRPKALLGWSRAGIAARSGRTRPLDLGGQWHAHDCAECATVQGVALHDENGRLNPGLEPTGSPRSAHQTSP